MRTIEDYIRENIKKGDEGSQLLAKRTAPTLKNSPQVRIVDSTGMNSLVAIEIPRGHYGLVHSCGGNPEILDIEKYSASMVDRLVAQSHTIHAQPLCFADVIDSSSGEIPLLDKIITAIVGRANHYRLPIMNGENAILGDVIAKQANVTGTMVSIIPEDEWGQRLKPYESRRFVYQGVSYVVFNPGDKLVYMNSDGIGTKTEFYLRLLDLAHSRIPFVNTFKHWFGHKTFARLLDDSLAMKLDDTIKVGAQAIAVSDVVETSGKIPMRALFRHAKKYSKQGIQHIIQQEPVGDRIRSFREDMSAINVSGSAVSLIDEKYLKNPLRPSAGEYLIAIRGTPNPRSNGITAKRKLMTEWLTNQWHKTLEGLKMLNYLAQPSSVLYPLFKELLDTNNATSFYHMSGGAYEGKLARPLAKYGLFVKIDNLFSPDERELTLLEKSGNSVAQAYGAWPMGTDGFITTSNPDEAMKIITKFGYEARVVGQLEQKFKMTGVELTAYNGETVRFSGVKEDKN